MVLVSLKKSGLGFFHNSLYNWLHLALHFQQGYGQVVHSHDQTIRQEVVMGKKDLAPNPDSQRSVKISYKEIAAFSLAFFLYIGLPLSWVATLFSVFVMALHTFFWELVFLWVVGWIICQLNPGTAPAIVQNFWQMVEQIGARLYHLAHRKNEALAPTSADKNSDS